MSLRFMLCGAFLPGVAWVVGMQAQVGLIPDVSDAACSNFAVYAQAQPENVAGSMKADKQNLRMEELDLLFQAPSFDI